MSECLLMQTLILVNIHACKIENESALTLKLKEMMLKLVKILYIPIHDGNHGRKVTVM